MTSITIVAIVAIAAACGFAALAWVQRRDEQQRSAARVAALAADIDGPAELAFERPMLKTRDYAPLEMTGPAGPPRNRWVMAAGAVPLVFVVAALLVTRGPRPAATPPAVRQPESLELLDMRHDRTGDVLTVTGTVRVHGRYAAPVTAIVTGRDGAGRIVASAHAPVDDAALDRGGESSFRVSVPGGHDVRRYQVRFETPLGPLTHIDRRAVRTASATTP